MANSEVCFNDNKRVSFGGDEQVKMIVYDDITTPDDITAHPTRTSTAFTMANAPQVRVRVTSEDKDVPKPILPPAQIEESRSPSSVVVISPTLPTFKKMESESSMENPFRPQQSLYHEVDPIVEAYRQRPFPPSPAHSPVPLHPGSGANSTATTTASPSSHGHWFSRSSAKEDHETSNSSRNELANDHTHAAATPVDGQSKHRSSSAKRGSSRQASLSEARTDRFNSSNPEMQLLQNSGGRIPPPGKAEIIHIDAKKRKCRCCCVQ